MGRASAVYPPARTDVVRQYSNGFFKLTQMHCGKQERIGRHATDPHLIVRYLSGIRE